MEGSTDQDFTYQFRVGMTCEGCSNAIKKLLGTEKYVKTFEINIEEKRVTIVGVDGIEQ